MTSIMTSCVGEVVRVTIFYKITRAISKKGTLSIVYSYGHATHRKKSRPSSTLTHPPLARLHVETPRREMWCLHKIKMRSGLVAALRQIKFGR